MKYQGFYDYTLDGAGNPDRTYTAQQFCKHMSMIFGNGIVITNLTGDNPWKVEKIQDENLKIKVKLGNNNLNFASVNGNPFAVDEELVLELSQGTDRWDSIMIRSDNSSTVRATDLKVIENSIELVRNDSIYDLRIARIHVANDVITEVIDDRFNDDYCGIAAGLATINADEVLTRVEEELEAIESGELVALKNGLLQTGLNSEMVGGKTFDEICEIIKSRNDLIQKYNVPTLDKLWDDYNYLSLSNEITQYEKGMRVLLEVEHQYTDFNQSILPKLTTAEVPVKGFESYEIEPFDKTDSTYIRAYMPKATMIGCVPIKATKISYRAGGEDSSSFEIRASNVEKPSKGAVLSETIATGKVTRNAISDEIIELDGTEYYKNWQIYGNENGMRFYIYRFDIIEGSVSKFNSALESYLNINNLGYKLVVGTMEVGKKYELVYDGTVFNAREVI